MVLNLVARCGKSSTDGSWALLLKVVQEMGVPAVGDACFGFHLRILQAVCSGHASLTLGCELGNLAGYKSINLTPLQQQGRMAGVGNFSLAMCPH